MHHSFRLDPDPPQPTEKGMQETIRRARLRIRRRRRTAAAGTVGLLVVVLGGMAIVRTGDSSPSSKTVVAADGETEDSGGPSEPRSDVTASTPDSEPRAVTPSTSDPHSTGTTAPVSDANIDESPFSFTLPEGWRTVEGELYLDDPSISTYQELTVSSGPIEAEASRRCVLPVAAVEQLGPHDAFVSIRTGQTSVFFVKERPPVDEMMPEDVFPSQWIDLCLSRPTEILFSETGFQQEGKPFVVYVGIGPEASGERINEVRAVLESLVIS